MTWVITIQSGFARPKIVLLTSVNEELHQHISTLDGFSNAFVELGVEVEEIHNADQYDLYHVLENPSVNAVIWLSHGGQGENVVGNLRIPSVLCDRFGYDVSGVLRCRLPTLSYLALVSCYSKSVADQISDNLEESGTKIQIRAFAGEVHINEGLKLVIEEVKNYLKDQYHLRSPEIHQKPSSKRVTIIRTFNQKLINSKFFAPSVRIEAAKNIFAVLPRSTDGKQQEITFDLPEESIDQLSINAGVSLNSENTLGDFQFINNQYQWCLLRRRDGEPLGNSMRVYRKMTNCLRPRL